MTEILEILTRFGGRLSKSSDPDARNAGLQLVTDVQRLQKRQKGGSEVQNGVKLPLLEAPGRPS